jgi:hypothetical protein
MVLLFREPQLIQAGFLYSKKRVVGIMIGEGPKGCIYLLYNKNTFYFVLSFLEFSGAN